MKFTTKQSTFIFQAERNAWDKQNYNDISTKKLYKVLYLNQVVNNEYNQ